jgi:hypothetical protein
MFFFYLISEPPLSFLAFFGRLKGMVASHLAVIQAVSLAGVAAATAGR